MLSRFPQAERQWRCRDWSRLPIHSVCISMIRLLTLRVATHLVGLRSKTSLARIPALDLCILIRGPFGRASNSLSPARFRILRSGLEDAAAATGCPCGDCWSWGSRWSRRRGGKNDPLGANNPRGILGNNPFGDGDQNFSRAFGGHETVAPHGPPDTASCQPCDELSAYWQWVVISD